MGAGELWIIRNLQVWLTLKCVVECLVEAEGFAGVRTWAKAPLVYVLAMVRFPVLQNLDDFVAAFGQEIKGSYPSRIEHLNQIATADFGAEGLKFSTNQQKVWQFSREDKSRAVMLGPDFILLHCTHAGYPGHVDFAVELVSLIGKLSSVPGISLTYLVSMGYRYVDLIIPDAGETLEKYLYSWVIPGQFPATATRQIEFIEGGSVAAFRTGQGVLRFQAARCPPATLPPDLDSPFVRENNWVAERPPGDFALLDFDHGQQFTPAVVFSPEDATARLVEICQAGRKLFHESMTDFAREAWRYPQRQAVGEV